MSYPQYPDQPEKYPEGPGYGRQDERPAPARPGQLLAGCILTWIGSTLGLVMGIALLALSDSDDLIGALPDNTTRDDAQLVLQFTGGLLVVSCLLALLFSILAFTGKCWAAIALTVLAVLWILLGLYGLVTGGGGSNLLPVLWIALSAGLVMNGSREWANHKSGRSLSS